jgi:hypothetical protein
VKDPTARGSAQEVVDVLLEAMKAANISINDGGLEARIIETVDSKTRKSYFEARTKMPTTIRNSKSY